jgi:hypothetical protein
MLSIVAMKFGLAFAVALFFYVPLARAHEAIFAWTYTTDLTPKGHGEFEQWITARWEKEHGSYSVIDFREELEYSVTDNFQLANLSQPSLRLCERRRSC